MMFETFLTFFIVFGAAFGEDFEHDINLRAANGLGRDRFRFINTNIAEDKLSSIIDDFTFYGCEKMVVIRNKAHGDIRVTCRSPEETPKPLTIQPGKSYVFSFRPKKDRTSHFWCTVDYKQQIARFDVYNEKMPHMCPREMDEVYQYTIQHEGIYADGSKDSGSTKIRAFFEGHNKYILWEEFEKNETNGFLMTGLVDGGMCVDIPEQFDDKLAAVTVCYHHCIRLYEHLGCRGKVQTAQASDDCTDVGIQKELIGKLSAIKGC